MAEKLTAKTITDAQIEALKREAGCAGDFHMLKICRKAIDGDEGEREICANVINTAREEANS